MMMLLALASEANSFRQCLHLTGLMNFRSHEKLCAKVNIELRHSVLTVLTSLHAHISQVHSVEQYPLKLAIALSVFRLRLGANVREKSLNYKI